jgi:anti-sigma B factor antagonist
MYEPGEVEVAVEDGVSIVRLLGEHDLSTQQLLASRLARVIEGSDPLVFDVARAKFIDSTVMTAIRETQIALAQKGIPVALVIPEPPPRRVLTLIELLDLQDAVVIASSADDARRKLLGP